MNAQTDALQTWNKMMHIAILLDVGNANHAWCTLQTMISLVYVVYNKNKHNRNTFFSPSESGCDFRVELKKKQTKKVMSSKKALLRQQRMQQDPEDERKSSEDKLNFQRRQRLEKLAQIEKKKMLCTNMPTIITIQIKSIG